MLTFNVPVRSLTTLTLGCTLMIGCGTTAGTDPEEELGHPPAAMVAEWTFQSATVDGVAAQLSDALEWMTATVSAKLHIAANGSYQYEELDTGGTQLWTEGGWIFVDPEGGTIVVHVQYDSDGSATDQYTLEYSLGSGVLTLTQVEGGKTSVYTLTN